MSDLKPDRPSEDRLATHDGYIWPVERRLMRKATPIVQRMVEDINRARHAWGDGPVDLTLSGWSSDQVMTHGAAARQAVVTEQRAATQMGRDSFSFGADADPASGAAA